MPSLLHVRQAGRRMTIVLDDSRRQNALSTEMVGEIEIALGDPRLPRWMIAHEAMAEVIDRIEIDSEEVPRFVLE